MLVNSQSDMEAVAETDDLPRALELAKQACPDVVVLDLTMPGGASLPLIADLAALPSAPRVLILTMHDDPAYVRAALAAGAIGYVVKTISESDLLEAIRQVRRGRMVIDLDSEERTQSVFGALSQPSGRASAAPQQPLSARESEVLRLLGQGHSNQAIAEQLDVSPKTVATYRARIGEKLGLKTTADFVKYAIDTGLIGN